jgi:hypothetical protein
VLLKSAVLLNVTVANSLVFWTLAASGYVDLKRKMILVLAWAQGLSIVTKSLTVEKADLTLVVWHSCTCVLTSCGCTSVHHAAARLFCKSATVKSWL